MIQSGTTITPELKAKWLAARLESVGASEAAAALGLSPWCSPLELWTEKVKPGRPRAPTEAMEWGSILEDPILDFYGRRTRKPVLHRQTFLRHADRPYMTATLDGVTAEGIIVDAKNVGTDFYGKWGVEGSADVPDIYLLQMAQQLACAGPEYTVGHFAVLFGGQSFKVYEVHRPESLIRALYAGVERFWDFVERRVPPDYGRVDAASLALLNPLCDGSVPLPGEVESLVLEWERLRESKKACEQIEDHLQGQILAALGNHQFGLLSDGRRVKRYLAERPACVKTVHYKQSTSHYFAIVKGEK